MTFVVSLGRSCTDVRPERVEVDFDFLKDKLNDPRVVAYSLAEFSLLSVDERGRAKDHSYFIGGECASGSRQVMSRTLLTLDIDFAPAGWDLDRALARAGISDTDTVWYSTISHTPEKPKYRLVIRLSEPLSDKLLYQAICRSIMKNLGLTRADATGFRYGQVMFDPQRLTDQPFFWGSTSGAGLDAEDYLELNCEEWAEGKNVPLFEGETNSNTLRSGDHVVDPASRPGIIGAFNRMVSISDVLQAWLPAGAYEYCSTRPNGTETWTRRGSSTSGGLHVYPDQSLCYNNHQSNEMLGTQHSFNAFDLARLELFGHLDKDQADMPSSETRSFKKFVKYLNTSDDPVVATFRDSYRTDNIKTLCDSLDVEFTDDPEAPLRPLITHYESGTQTSTADVLRKLGYDFSGDPARPNLIHEPFPRNQSDMMAALNHETLGIQQTKTGIKASTQTLHCLIWNVPELHMGIGFNVITGRMTHTARSVNKCGSGNGLVGRPVDDSVFAHIQLLLSQRYRLEFGVSAIYSALLNSCQRCRSYHPVFSRVTQVLWDGVPRLPTFFRDYYGVAPGQNPEVIQIVGVLMFVNTVRRGLYPGCVCPFAPFLYSPAEGTGKSSWGQMVAGDDLFSDNVDISTIQRLKESVQGVWIGEIPELSSLSKKSSAEVKALLSRNSVDARDAYGRAKSELALTTFFYGTTNEQYCLKDSGQNRRSPVVEVVGLKDREKLARDIPQLLAEAYNFARRAPINLTGDIAAMFEESQRKYHPSDANSALETWLRFIQNDDFDDFDDRPLSVNAGDAFFAVREHISSESKAALYASLRSVSTERAIEQRLTQLGYTRSRFRENGKRVWGVSLTDRVKLQKAAAPFIGKGVEIVTHEEMAAISLAADLSVMGDPISAESLTKECEKAEVNYKAVVNALTERQGYVASQITSGADKGLRVYRPG